MQFISLSVIDIRAAWDVFGDFYFLMVGSEASFMLFYPSLVSWKLTITGWLLFQVSFLDLLSALFIARALWLKIFGENFTHIVKMIVKHQRSNVNSSWRAIRIFEFSEVKLCYTSLIIVTGVPTQLVQIFSFPPIYKQAFPDDWETELILQFHEYRHLFIHNSCYKLCRSTCSSKSVSINSVVKFVNGSWLTFECH